MAAAAILRNLFEKSTNSIKIMKKFKACIAFCPFFVFFRALIVRTAHVYSSFRWLRTVGTQFAGNVFSFFLSFLYSQLFYNKLCVFFSFLRLCSCLMTSSFILIMALSVNREGKEREEEEEKSGCGSARKKIEKNEIKTTP